MFPVSRRPGWVAVVGGSQRLSSFAEVGSVSDLGLAWRSSLLAQHRRASGLWERKDSIKTTGPHTTSANRLHQARCNLPLSAASLSPSSLQSVLMLTLGSHPFIAT